jgi:hydroxyacylglutathione hydrolase
MEYDMKVYQINSSPYEANAFLVVTKKPVLVDVGMNASYILDRITEIMEPDKVETIILTHGHYDHWGAVEEVRQKTGASVALHEDDMYLLDDDVSNVSAMFGAHGAGFTPDRLLCAGELIDLGDGSSLEVIHTPGHTPGSISLYHAGSKILFTGDTVFPGGSFGRTDLTGGSQEQLVESLKLLFGLDVEVMYPGHGDVTDNDVAGQISMSMRLAQTYL